MSSVRMVNDNHGSFFPDANDLGRWADFQYGSVNAEWGTIIGFLNENFPENNYDDLSTMEALMVAASIWTSPEGSGYIKFCEDDENFKGA